MEKIFLKKIKQNNKVFYTGVIDPRKVANLLPEIAAGEGQESQRPWVEKKVKEIAEYVAGKIRFESELRSMGLIPNAPIVALKRPFEIHTETISITDSDNNQRSEEVCYFELPSTEEEMQAFKGAFEPIDGQHRLRSFQPEYMDPSFKTSDTYEMVFSFFIDLDTNEKRELFMVTNEKQDKMSTNLLRFFKRALGLLDDFDELTSEIITKLNNEDFSPLKGRIMTAGESISKGYKEIQVSKIIKYQSPDFKGLVRQYIVADDTQEIMLFSKLLSNYLKAWEVIYNASFQTPGKETLTKISGIRYILLLLPKINEILVHNRWTGTQENFSTIITALHENVLATEDIFESNNLAFRGEGATVKLAKDHSEALFNHYQNHGDVFNPMAGI
ncbi:hypothetical protein COD89_22675 [Bacillus thuringiensis]|uniref:DGQHR domain-containing protein n=1 Tax=Bacillus thuringiensis TaxID=1428 RepID=UPI000BED88A5|nr:DGQHR domain-containing protein [Bacillus thuringiensis]MRC18373.1 DGQHR domain-containing protein [Bacillus thuringiensis]PDY96491.1 hypothetical protein CON12_30045 [Bacillus thuringiensis]PFB95295.1 hypothetical protein CN302_21940 [Bacillus thuringiensis]PGV55236.1 hypothetical protein COD89_22675 [Bacillus thuringiensis]